MPKYVVLKKLNNEKVAPITNITAVQGLRAELDERITADVVTGNIEAISVPSNYYTKDEIHSLINTGGSGGVIIDSALSDSSINPVQNKVIKVALDNKQDVISDLSTIRNNAQLATSALQSFTETDPTVPAWAKQVNKPSYTATEVGALPSDTIIPSALSDLTDDSTHRVVTDTEKNSWSAKQAALVSGTNIKTINGKSLLGSGNITISAGNYNQLNNNELYSIRPTFAGYEISSGPLYYDGTNFKIKDYWDYSSYEECYGKVKGSTYFNFVELGQIFDSRGYYFDETCGSIDNAGNVNEYKLPTKAQWNEIVGTDRDGATVNNSSNKHFANIYIYETKYLEGVDNEGLLLFPDNFVITGKNIHFDDYYSNYLTLEELNVYINQGCAFLPNIGSYLQWYDDSWVWNVTGCYWSATANLNDNTLSDTLSLDGNDYGSKKNEYFSVRLIKTADSSNLLLTSKEDKINKVTSISQRSSIYEYPSAKTVYYAIHPAIEGAMPEDGFKPNVPYHINIYGNGDIVWKFDKPIPNILNHYYWIFTTSYSTPTITWPIEITKWVGGAPIIEPNSRYEISVIDGIACYIQL